MLKWVSAPSFAFSAQSPFSSHPPLLPPSGYRRVLTPAVCSVPKDHCGSTPKEWASALSWTNQSPFLEDYGKLVMEMD